MQKVCRNCCKIFCPQRDEVTECNKQVTFVTQLLQELDDKVKSQDLIYTSELMNFKNKHERKLKKHKKGAKKMVIEDIEKTLEVLKEIEFFFRNIEDVEKKLKTDLINKEAEQEDLLHEIELSKLNAIEIMTTYKQLETVRKERRVIKNKLELIRTIKPYSDSFIRKGICGETTATIKNIETLKSNQKNRNYIPRVLKGLKCAKKKGENVGDNS